MVQNLDALFYARKIGDEFHLIRIKKSNDKYWSYFAPDDLSLDRHPVYIQTHFANLNTKRKNSRMRFRFTDAQISDYYDENCGKFKFNGEYLKVCEEPEYVKRREDGKRDGEINRKKKLTDIKRIAFKVGTSKPQEFIEQFESCFNEKQDEQLKKALEKFIPRSDKTFWHENLSNDSYETVKQVFISRYTIQEVENGFSDLSKDISKKSKVQSEKPAKVNRLAQLTMPEKVWIETELSLGIRSKVEIADKLGISRQTVYNFIERLESNLSPLEKYTRKRSVGHPKLTLQNLIDLEEYVLDHPFALNREIVVDLGLKVTEKTIGNYLRKLGYSTHAVKKTFLNANHINERLNWANENISCTLTMWKRVIFTGECVLENCYSGKGQVKRKRGMSNNSQNIETYESPSNLRRKYFGVLIYNQPFQIFECKESTDPNEFNRLIIEQVMPSILSYSLNDPIIQMDNVAIHSDTVQVLKSAGFVFLPWVEKSCDLSIIDNLWALISRRKNAELLNRSISNQFEFDEIIRRIVSEIPIQTINRLYESLPSRVENVLRNGGRAIRT